MITRFCRSIKIIPDQFSYGEEIILNYLFIAVYKSHILCKQNINISHLSIPYDEMFNIFLKLSLENIKNSENISKEITGTKNVIINESPFLLLSLVSSHTTIDDSEQTIKVNPSSFAVNVALEVDNCVIMLIGKSKGICFFLEGVHRNRAQYSSVPVISASSKHVEEY
uniref:Uncharacterized protein n=1 Tax=Heterorhabditis bacteriophora TaxID=37862 RepID=A0A1I7WT68_HETBA